MRGTVELTHVSVVAANLQEAIDWYAELFGVDAIAPVPNPRLISPTVWLKLGSLGLHITEWPERTNVRRVHFGIGVMEPALFHNIYQKAKARGLFDHETFGSHIYEMPAGEIQMYLLDPGGNLVEVDFPDATLIDRSIVDDMPKITDLYSPQPDDVLQSTLFPWLRVRHADAAVNAEPESTR